MSRFHQLFLFFFGYYRLRRVDINCKCERLFVCGSYRLNVDVKHILLCACLFKSLLHITVTHLQIPYYYQRTKKLCNKLFFF